MAWRRERPAEGGARGAGPAAPLLVVQGLDVHYGRAHALQDVSLTLERGVLGIVGRNGMGKTTLCNAITGLVPARGSVRLAGQEHRHRPSVRPRHQSPQTPPPNLAPPAGPPHLPRRRPLAPRRRPS